MSTESIFLILILIFCIIMLSRFIVRMMKTKESKFKIMIYYSRILLGFLIAMTFYISFMVLKGEDVIEKFLG